MRISKVIFATTLVAAAAQAEAQPGTVEPEYVPPPRAHRRDPLATTEQWGGGLRLTGLSGIGALPGVNFGGEVAINVRRDELFAELAMGRWTPEDAYHVIVSDDVASNPELRLDVWTLRVGRSSMRTPLRAWVLAELGEVAGTGSMIGMPGVVTRMVTGDTPNERRWKALGAGIGVAWPMSNQARLVGNMEIAVPVDREPLPLDVGGVYEPDALAARYSMGLEVGWR